MSQNEVMPLTQAEIRQSVLFGNKLAEQIAANKPAPRWASVIRHVNSTRGREAAVRLAERLCRMTAADAIRHVRKCCDSRADDVILPWGY